VDVKIENPKRRRASQNGVLVYDPNANAVVKIVGAKNPYVSIVSALLDFEPRL